MITTSSLSGVAGDVMRLGCRIALGVTLLLHPVCDSLGWANGLHAQAGGFQEVQMVFLQLSDMRNIVVGSLFFLIAIWVVFGIRTRVMASLATALVLTFHFAVAHEPWRLDHQMLLTLIAIAIAVPLICCGGGRFSLWRGGWGNLL